MNGLARPVPPSGPAIGTVLRIETGVVVCRTTHGEVRASWGPRLLARVARNRAAEPVVGDRVGLTWWPDGRITVDAVRRPATRRTDSGVTDLAAWEM